MEINANYDFIKNDQSILNQVNSLLINNEFEKAYKLIDGSNISEDIKDECIGNYYFYKRDFNNAIHYFKSALKVNSDAKLSRYHYLSGIGYERLKKYDDAFAHYVESIDIDPLFVDPYIDLGGMLSKLKDFAKAAKCYRDAIKITPNDITLYLNLKKILEKIGVSNVESKKELEEVNEKINCLENIGVKIPPMNSW